MSSQKTKVCLSGSFMILKHIYLTIVFKCFCFQNVSQTEAMEILQLIIIIDTGYCLLFLPQFSWDKKRGGGQHLILIEYYQQLWELACSSVSTMLICLYIVLLPRIRNLLFEMFVMHFSGRHRAHGKFRFSRLQIFYILGSYISWQVKLNKSEIHL